ncbi:serpin family protein [Niabella sp. CC-SYL272]|uniref:serpin family protein n=1 Tax=Niabella agricola TaxID=2891571 RepID=UPI001F3019DD|nr:serpin family protein [Niabella agricola]MCF3107434.1 serpin family protein [Niabella agricola]
MKQWRLFFLGGWTALILGSCSKAISGKPDPKSSKQTPIAISAPVSASMSAFSFSFFKELQKKQPSGSNIFISPLSLHMAMSMVANGATGETRDEILDALQAKDLSADSLNAACFTLLEELPKADPAVTLGLANVVFYKNSFPVEASFLKTLNDYYKAGAAGLSFQPSDLPVINKWASDHTNGKITKVLDQLDPDLVLLLMNALYFKGDWRVKFDKSQTRPETFTKADGSTMQVNMMHRTDTIRYAAATDFDAIQKPYGNGQFTLTVLLPKTNAVADLFNQMDAQKWDALQHSFYTTKLEIGIPSFKLKQEFTLNQTLEAMGIKKAFGSGASFDALSKAAVQINLVKQNTFAALDEEGTEAAAVTTVGINVTSAGPPSRFICNRPFGIIISEHTSKSILFMGAISQPVALP